LSESTALVDGGERPSLTQLESVARDDANVQSVRSWTGLLAVIGGDLVIITAATIGVLSLGRSTTSASDMVAILTSAFTAVGTLTTAFFSIRAVANTAQQSAAVGAVDSMKR
jgi:hypothetical protein